MLPKLLQLPPGELPQLRFAFLAWDWGNSNCSSSHVSYLKPNNLGIPKLHSFTNTSRASLKSLFVQIQRESAQDFWKDAFVLFGLQTAASKKGSRFGQKKTWPSPSIKTWNNVFLRVSTLLTLWARYASVVMLFEPQDAVGAIMQFIKNNVKCRQQISETAQKPNKKTIQPGHLCI